MVAPLFRPLRRRWSAEDARAVLDRLESSGLSVRAFAAREGLEVHRLYRWRRLLGRSGRVARSAGPAFIEVSRVATAIIEVVLRTGHVVRVPSVFEEQALRRVVSVLEGAGC
jgi:transposase-like protein